MGIRFFMLLSLHLLGHLELSPWMEFHLCKTGKNSICMTRTTILLFIAAATLEAQKKPAPAAVSPGQYRCVFFINGALQTTPGFTIGADGT